MTPYSILNLNLYNALVNKLKSGTKMKQVTLNLSSNVIGDLNDEVNFPH